MDAPKDLDHVRVEGVVDGRRFFLQEVDLTQPGMRLPLTVVLRRTDGTPTGSSLLRVVGLSRGTPVVQNQTRVVVPRGRTRSVTLGLHYLCWGRRSIQDGSTAFDVNSACGAVQACRGGTCVDIGGEDLTETTGGEGRASTEAAKGCFDGLACFDGLSRRTPVLRGHECILPMPSAPLSKTSVAIIPAGASVGRCRSETGPCYIALDQGPEPDRWHGRGPNLILPLGACSADVEGVVISLRCPSKTASVPLCGPWTAPDLSPFPVDGSNDEGIGGAKESGSGSSAPPGLEPSLDRGGSAPGGSGDGGTEQLPSGGPGDGLCGGGYGTGTTNELVDVEGEIQGLENDGLVLALNRREFLSIPKGATHFKFSEPLGMGQLYDLEVQQDVSGPTTCIVRRGRGRATKDGAQGNLRVECVPRPKIVDLSFGWDHGCLVYEDGTLRCFGKDETGKPIADRPDVAVPGLQGVAQVSTLNNNTCVRMKDTTVRCWGDPDQAIGAGSSLQASIPGLSGVRQVALTKGVACALMEDTSVRCWGRDAKPGDSPHKAVSGLSGVVGLDAGVDGSILAVMANETVREYGSETPMALQGVRRIVRGLGHTCALMTDGTVRCWMHGDDWGQLGRTRTSMDTPIPGLSGVVDLDTNVWTTCALMKSGTVRCWGGEWVSNAIIEGSDVYHDMPGLTGVRRLAVGHTGACALREDGQLVCWGGLRQSPPAHGRGVYGVVSGLSGVVEIAAGAFHSCAVLVDKSMRCWGGGSSFPGVASSPLTSYGELPAVAQASTGDGFACARLEGGAVRCWGGMQPGGRLMMPLGRSADIPFLDDVRELASGLRACARWGPEGRVRCWQFNDPPYDVEGLTGVKQLVMKYHITCALLESGTVRCFQMPPSWVVNDADSISDLSGLSGVTKIGVGHRHFCALMADTTVRCWGNNDLAQTAGSSITSAVLGLSGVRDLALGFYHTCVLMNDGTVRCWGDNGVGQTGGSRPTEPVPFVNGAISIAASATQTCALLCDGKMLCWGDNSFGQITGTPSILQWIPLTP